MLQCLETSALFIGDGQSMRINLVVRAHKTIPQWLTRDLATQI